MVKALMIQLQHAGVDASSIDRTDRCTFEHEAEFFSHRRDRGITGRLAAMIALLPPI
jgi:copper oxidase (laccase) domain-containing protein